jgi:hypothetical protein
MKILLVLPLCLIASGYAYGVRNPAPDDHGSFIATLGRDTVVLESFTRTASKLDGNIVVRTPGTVLVHYALDLNANGTPSHSVAQINPLGVSDVPARTVTIDYKSDSAFVDVDSSGRHRKSVVAISGDVFPQLMTGFGPSYGLYVSTAMYELYPLPSAAGDSVRLTAMDLVTGHLVRRKLARRSTTQFSADYFGSGWTDYTIDGGNRITGGDATVTTEQTQIRRVGFMDASSAAKAFAAADRAGKGVGAASPGQITRGTLDGHLVVVTYSSPRLRGRAILGKVVPYGTVWRTGANEATLMIFDTKLQIGTTVLPGGAYSLWTLPKEDGSADLIINSEHGQWGTDYNSARDVAHIPMKVATSATRLEKFTITLPTGETGMLTMSWDNFVWSVPISVAK